MKLTKEQLKRIIKEELGKITNESEFASADGDKEMNYTPDVKQAGQSGVPMIDWVGQYHQQVGGPLEGNPLPRWMMRGGFHGQFKEEFPNIGQERDPQGGPSEYILAMKKILSLL